MINLHCAIQTCDIASYQGQKRYCSDSKTEITKKCVTSFLNSAKYLSNTVPEIKQNIKFFDDGSTIEVKNYLKLLQEKYTSENISIEIDFLENQGIAQSIKNCYTWLSNNGTHFVYQIQDDYMFFENSLYDTLQFYADSRVELNTEPILTPYNDPYIWGAIYRNTPTPRTIFKGRTQYWIQIYDITCSFLTSIKQFNNHWDIYEDFFKFIYDSTKKLEADSLNLILTKRGVLGACPITSTALHMQSEYEKDPYINWKSMWDKIEILQQ
jgi:hypothetical protein